MEYNVGKKTYLLLIISVIIVFAGCIMSIVLSDREAPVITVNEAALPSVYSDNMDVEELLNGVTAYDDEDGDVSNTLIVENMIVLSDAQSIKVVFAASDSHGNIGKEEVVLPYNGTKNFIDVSPEDTTKSTEEDTSEDVTEEITTAAAVEGGNGEPVKIDQEEANKTGIPQIELKYTDYTIHVGESFSAAEALDMVNATYDSAETVSNRIVINNLQNVDVNTVGDYVLNYSVSDTEGNRSDVRKLTLHVIE